MTTEGNSSTTREDAEADFMSAVNLPLPEDVAVTSTVSDDEMEAEGGNEEDDEAAGQDADDGEEDKDSDTDSIHSMTSTVEFQYEAFETFQEKARSLAQQKLWTDADPSRIEVEKMTSGGFNRIIGLTLKSIDPNISDTKVILRIPHWDDAYVDRDVAATRFVAEHTAIPVPTILQFDETDHNVLERPYMLMDRLEGISLGKVWPKMLHAQRLQVARELGEATQIMLATRNPTGGQLVTLPGRSAEGDPTLRVFPFSFYDLLDQQTPENIAKPTMETTNPLLGGPEAGRSVFDELLRIFTKQLHVQETRDPDRIWDEYEGMVQMTHELQNEGWLDGVRWSLCHLDFQPRNIHVKPDASLEESIITAILDWDSAVLGPNFTTCRPPCWIWTPCNPEEEEDLSDDEDDESEPLVYEEPEDEECQELKKAFEDGAGSEYMRFAYHPAYRLARILFSFILSGINTGEHNEACEEMLKEWNEAKETWRRGS